MKSEKKDILDIIKNKRLFTPFRNKSILITGATGLIGSMLIKVLFEANKVYNLNIKIIGQVRNNEKAKKILSDIFSKIVIIPQIDINADFIIHTISPTGSTFFIKHPVETIKISTSMTFEALETARKNKSKIVYLSSMEQYGVPYSSGQIMNETTIGLLDHLNIRSCYSESKRLCECLCKSYHSEYSVDVKIARLAQTFGVGTSKEDDRMPMQFAKSVINNENIVLHTEGESITNSIYITDAISGILTILHYGEAGEVYNVCNDNESRTVKEVAKLIAEKITHDKINVEFDIPEGKNFGYAPTVKMYLDSSKLKQLGWIPQVNLIKGYTKLIDYLYELKEYEDF